MKAVATLFDAEKVTVRNFSFYLEQVTLLQGFAHFDKGTTFEGVVLDVWEGTASIGDCTFSLRIDLGEDCACRCQGCGEYDGPLCSGGRCCM